MSVILVDLTDSRHDLQINFWNWRPILVLLREAGIIDEAQFGRLSLNGCGARLTDQEAKKVAVYIKQNIIPRLSQDERMHADGRISAVPSQPRPIATTSADELYAAKKSCLESFVAFCEASQGFEVF